MRRYRATVVDSLTNAAVIKLCVLAVSARAAADIAHTLLMTAGQYDPSNHGIKIVTLN